MEISGNRSPYNIDRTSSPTDTKKTVTAAKHNNVPLPNSSHLENPPALTTPLAMEIITRPPSPLQLIETPPEVSSIFDFLPPFPKTDMEVETTAILSARNFNYPPPLEGPTTDTLFDEEIAKDPKNEANVGLEPNPTHLSKKTEDKLKRGIEFLQKNPTISLQQAKLELAVLWQVNGRGVRRLCAEFKTNPDCQLKRDFNDLLANLSSPHNTFIKVMEENPAYTAKEIETILIDKWKLPLGRVRSKIHDWQRNKSLSDRIQPLMQKYFRLREEEEVAAHKLDEYQIKLIEDFFKEQDLSIAPPVALFATQTPTPAPPLESEAPRTALSLPMPKGIQKAPISKQKLDRLNAAIDFLNKNSNLTRSEALKKIAEELWGVTLNNAQRIYFGPFIKNPNNIQEMRTFSALLSKLPSTDKHMLGTKSYPKQTQFVEIMEGHPNLSSSEIKQLLAPMWGTTPQKTDKTICLWAKRQVGDDKLILLANKYLHGRTQSRQNVEKNENRLNAVISFLENNQRLTKIEAKEGLIGVMGLSSIASVSSTLVNWKKQREDNPLKDTVLRLYENLGQK